MAGTVRKLYRALRHAVKGELRMFGAVGRALARRPIARSAITFSRESTYPGVAFGLGVAIAVEAGAVHLLLASHPALSAMLLAVSGYSLVWLAGDLRALRESTCRFERGALMLEVALRGAVRVPLHVIAVAARLEPAGAGVERAFRLTPGDPPNVKLELRKSVVGRGFLGVRRRARAIHLYVDDPAAFLTGLAEELSRARGVRPMCAS